MGCKQPRPSSAPSSAGTADLVASILVAVCSTSTKATRKAFRAFVKAALASYEVTQGFIQVLEFHRVPQQPRPFAPRPTIDLVGISRAKNHSGERFRSGSLTDLCPRRCKARWARLTALPSFAHAVTVSKIADKY